PPGHRRPRPVRPRSYPDPARRQSDEASRLQLGLAPLLAGVGPPRDAGAGAELEPPLPLEVTPGPERADADREARLPGVGVDPPDRSAVRTTGGGLELGDRPQCRGLRCPGHR